MALDKNVVSDSQIFRDCGWKLNDVPFRYRGSYDLAEGLHLGRRKKPLHPRPGAGPEGLLQMDDPFRPTPLQNVSYYSFPKVPGFITFPIQASRAHSPRGHQLR